MTYRIFLLVGIVTLLTGCPIAMMGQPPSKIPTPDVNSLYPKLVKAPDINDYIDTNVHIDTAGLTEYRRALAQYRAYLDRYESLLTERYSLSERDDVEKQIVYKTVEVPTKSTVNCDQVCPVANAPTNTQPPKSFQFRPLLPPAHPVFKRDVDSDADIIDKLVDHILQVHKAIDKHNEEHMSR